jgi:hypothetical protein
MSKAAQAQKIETTDEKVAKAQPVTVSRFANAVEVANTWRVTCSADTDPQGCLDQHYWANVSMHLRPGDEIVIIPENMTWEMHLRVLGAGRLFAHVAQLSFQELKASVEPILLPKVYEVVWSGVHHKWAVIREGNKLKDGFETEALARRYAQNHEAAVMR